MVWVCRRCHDEGGMCKKVGNVIYCSPPVQNSRVTGSDAITLAVEELCVFDIYKSQNNAENWWDYMNALYACKNSNYSRDCIERAQDKVGIDKVKLSSCNLRAADISLHEYTSSGIPYNPAIVINNHVYRVRQHNNNCLLYTSPSPRDS